MLRFQKNLSIISFIIIFSTKAAVIPEIQYLDYFDGLDVETIVKALENPHPDAYLTTVQLIDKYGYNAESYTVTTNDNYILEMHRINGHKNDSNLEKKPAVLLIHGLLSSSTDWIIMGPKKALGYILADAGYDVWLGNVRGNTYSRNHLSHSVDGDEFWNFSWHEIGINDLPVMIDKILEITGNEKIFYIGHSQGTTSFFVMASEMPEYDNKIISMHALAPVTFCKHLTSPPMRFLSDISGSLELVAKFFGINELRLTQEFYDKFTSKVCAENSLLQPLCSNILFWIGGFNLKQLNMTMLPTILGHVPAGASVKQAFHYSQLMKNNYFRQYDHGLLANKKKYGTFKPPNYDLSQIKVPVHLHYSVNDFLAHPKDVDKLYNRLGNPAGKFRVPMDEFTHLDYIWAIDADKLIYEKIISLMSRYRENNS